MEQPQDGEPTPDQVENGGIYETWLQPRADTGVAWCMRFLVLFAVLVILAELGLLIYLGVLNQQVLFKFNESAVPIQPFSWTGSQLPMNLTIGNNGAATYGITLKISEDLNSFTGSMTLNFQTTATQKGIVLHGKGLTVTRAQLGTLPTGSTDFTYQDSKTIAYDTTREYIFLTFPVNVPVGQVALLIEWAGSVSTGTEGLYKSYYVDQATGTTKTLLATQFEPNYARRVFPCFDEPLYRAKFDLSIVVPNSFTTSKPLGNTAIIDASTLNNGVNTTYTFSENVKPYPPYLVAFVIGDMYPTTTVTTSTLIPITVWVSRPDQVALANFAAARAKEYVEWFSAPNQLSTSYAFSKMDIVALPDFAEGAMENPGLLIFRDTAVLVDNAAAPSFASRMRVAEIVAHEVAHQWFGNLITPYYWNDLWVAEGSATYFSYLAVDQATQLGFNYYNTFFFAEETLPALNADELLSTSPVYHNVSTPAQARSAFDISSYSKGGSFIRHLVAQLTSTNAIWTNLRSAFGQNAGSMTSQQYLDALSTTTISFDNSLGDQNQAYIFKPTMPVFNVSVNNASGVLTGTMMSYSNFYAHTYNDTTASWLMPLKIQTPSSLITLPSLTATSRSAAMTTIPQAAWYKANSDGLSYFRTQYPISNWQNLIAAIAAGTATTLTANDKAGLISDAFSWAEIGQLPYSIVIGLLNATLKETEQNYVVWRTALSELQTLRGLVQDSSCDGNFDSMVKSWVLPASQYWTWDVNSTAPNTTARNETVSTPGTAATVALRNLILGAGAEYINNHYSSYLEVENYIATAQTAFDDYMASPSTPLPVETASTILKTVMLHAPWQTWDKVYAKYLTTVEVGEKNRLLVALSWTAERSKAISLLKSMATSSSVVRSQDHVTVLRTVVANPEVGADAVWEVFQDNSASIMSKFPQNVGYWMNALTGLNRAAPVSNYFTTTYPDMDISGVLEIINDNAEWIADLQASFCAVVQPLYPNKRDFTL